MYCLRLRAECVPPTWLAPGLDQGPSSLLPAWYQFWSFRSFLPSPKCLGVPSPRTPLNSYTSTLLCRHPCRHGCSSLRLQAIHMHHCERLVSFPTHDDLSPVQYFGDEYHGNCSFVPRVRSNVML